MNIKIWAQIIFFVITNAPSLLKAFKDLKDLFGADKQTAKDLLKDLHDINVSPKVENSKVSEDLRELLDRYKSKK